MAEYEVLVRTVKPCPGEAHDKETFIEIEADDPILDYVQNLNGETIITTGDRKGNFVRYNFAK